MLVSGKVEIRETQNGKTVFAKNNIKKDAIIFEFEKNYLKHPTRTTMQIDENVHQYSSNTDSFENFINHSCEPSGYINFSDLTLRALRVIKKGEEITFNYLTTEWDMSNKFECKCGSKKCFGKIRGFKYLSLKQKKELESFLSPLLKKNFKNDNSIA